MQVKFNKLSGGGVVQVNFDVVLGGGLVQVNFDVVLGGGVVQVNVVLGGGVVQCSIGWREVSCCTSQSGQAPAFLAWLLLRNYHHALHLRHCQNSFFQLISQIKDKIQNRGYKLSEATWCFKTLCS